MPAPKGYVEIFGFVTHETLQAIQADFGTDELIWFPKSQLEDWPDVGDSGDILMPQWLAEEKGVV